MPDVTWQVMTLPPGWGEYPNHVHDASAEEAGQEEVYIPIGGSAILAPAADDDRADDRRTPCGKPRGEFEG